MPTHQKPSFFSTGRRDFLKKSSLGLGAALMGPSLMAMDEPLHPALPDDEKLGVALVGLGYYATHKLATALAETRYCKLVGLVTGSPEKVPDFKEKYGIKDKDVYNYQNFDKIKDNPDIDIVYVVLPNAMHAEYSVRAAEAGKHVICEKPMEVSVAKAQQMVDACKKAGKLLQIGYRCQYDPYHRELMRISHEKVYGEVKVLQTSFSFYGVNGSNWRFTDKSLSGGGPLMDVGVYCIQAARYTMGQEPIAITARSYKTIMDKMPDMEETIAWEMEFPNGAVAHCLSSYVANDNFVRVTSENGTFGLRPAFSYDPVEGFFRGGDMSFPRQNQQAVQMDAFARNILDGTPVVASGEEGLQDMKMIEAMYKAAKTGKRVKL